ncbi:uroporphyrinogen-III synthase [Halobacillus litoralis]|uniref:uroporphyrinogen-III synthase n=1 Tax=Halobacillus litoralis TaxID=45668 RepID=UPI001CFD6879|nr:uroporphyrinogen-III synthase [Halobacillus litoralis]
MAGLENKRIGIAADRRSDAISNLVKNMGGHPYNFPIQGRQVLNESLCAQNVTDYLKETFEWVILTTGIGARTLDHAAKEKEVRDSFIHKLAAEKLAVRGSKTIDWLKENDLKPVLTAEDGTMSNLFTHMKTACTEGHSRVFLQAYNQDDELLKVTLEKLGYSVYLSKPYAFHPPESEYVDGLKKSILLSEVDAVVFTSKTQVINLFKEEKEKITEAFNRDVLAVAVGKVTAKELENQGIVTVLQPEKPKMGAMIVTLDRYYQTQTAVTLKGEE